VWCDKSQGKLVPITFQSAQRVGEYLSVQEWMGMNMCECVCVCVCVCVLYIIFIRRAELLYRCPLPWSRLQTWGRKVAHTFCRTLPNSNSRLCLRHEVSTGRCLYRCHCGLTARRIKRFQHIFCCITSVLCQAYHRYKEGIREKTERKPTKHTCSESILIERSSEGWYCGATCQGYHPIQADMERRAGKAGVPGPC